MKKETLDILDKVENGELKKHEAAEQLFVLFGVSGSLPEPIEFAKWLKHLDNGTEHYNPETEEKSNSIGYSPYDCFMDDLLSVEELYERWRNDR